MIAGMRWVATVASGLGGGAFISVLPIDCFFLLAIPVALATWALTGKPELRRAGLVALGLMTVTGALATAAPFKFIDRTRVRALSDRCVRVEEVVRAIPTRPELRSELLEREICFGSREPTLREVERALAPMGVSMKLRYCADGATLLWGAYPIGGPRLVSPLSPTLSP